MVNGTWNFLSAMQIQLVIGLHINDFISILTSQSTTQGGTPGRWIANGHIMSLLSQHRAGSFSEDGQD
jgi:hypothetical protein